MTGQAEQRHLDSRPVNGFEGSAAGQAYERGRLEELAERGKAWGLSVREVAEADAAGMPVARYAALRGVRSVDDFRRVRQDERDREQARAEAAHDRLVDEERRRLGGAA